MVAAYVMLIGPQRPANQTQNNDTSGWRAMTWTALEIR